ncbi:MAG: DUF3006 domain-containing protein [Limnochordia bacterium]|jgi:hypothetical protein|nr:DUF3006 domain-containing protein [Bacillota bacterium]
MRLSAVIDRFEGDIAVLEIETGGQCYYVDWPAALLPQGARPGSWLWITLERDLAGEEASRERIKDLLQRLKERER